MTRLHPQPPPYQHGSMTPLDPGGARGVFQLTSVGL